MNTINSLIDLTLLNTEANEEDIKHLAAKGELHDVAALCIFPQHLKYIPTNSTLPLATVLNFPSGNEPHDEILKKLIHIKKNNTIQEIDYVFPYSMYLTGNTEQALAQCAELYQYCKQHHLLFKVILETGALPSTDAIYQISRDVIQHGCDFLKTSTGKVAIGATIPAAEAMLTAIIDSKKTCGIKLSGGIKTFEQADSYVQLAEKMMNIPVDKTWFRIGASNLPQTA